MHEMNETSGRRFASLVALAERALSTFFRFPLSIVSAVVAALAAHLIVEFDVADNPAIVALWPIVMVAILGIPLFYVLRVFAESRAWSKWVRLAVTLAGLVALVAYYLALPVPVKGADVVSFLLILASVLLAASFLPFLGRPGQENGFWQYNKLMFLRLAAAALFAFVLWTGLSLALAACDALLGFDVDPEFYPQLWYWVTIVYSVWFFLAGIPRDVAALQQARDYPAALRVFAQYVLIPLVVLYLIILYAYMVKILVQWDLPQGWVGFPVIGVSISGLLALLLVHPVREQAEYRWIKPYARFFYWALYPLIVLIAVAIWTRIGEYGITEKRYLVVVATAWLLGIALYFTFKRTSDIRVIPVSLCLVALLSAFGPWGATSFARRSQLGRLQELLITEEVTSDGALTRTVKRVPFESEKQISDVVQYVIVYHGADRMRAWYAEPERLPEVLTPQVALEEMGLEYIGRWQREPDAAYVGVALPNPLPLAEFDYLYVLDCHDDSIRFRTLLPDGSELVLEQQILRLGRLDEPQDRLEVDLAPLLTRLRDKEEGGEDYGPDEARIDAENSAYQLLIYVSEATLGGEGDSLKVEGLKASLLIALR